MTITDEYLYNQKKYSSKYGNKTIVLMQVGSFHEMYATDEEGYNLKELSELLNITLTKKDKSMKVGLKNPYLMGFPSVSIQKYVRVLVSNGFTVPIINQTTPPPNPERALDKIHSPVKMMRE